MTAARFWTMRTTASVTTGSGPGGGGVSVLLAGRIRIEPDAGARSRSGYRKGIVTAGQGEVGNWSGQQAARNGLRILRLQSEAREARTTFDSDPADRLGHPVQRVGAIVGVQRGKRPIGFGKHVDAACGAY